MEFLVDFRRFLVTKLGGPDHQKRHRKRTPKNVLKMGAKKVIAMGTHDY